MITVKTDGASFVEIEGHAGYAPAGSDIVCAAVSALYETLRTLLIGQAIITETDELCRIQTRR